MMKTQSKPKVRWTLAMTALVAVVLVPSTGSAENDDPKLKDIHVHLEQAWDQLQQQRERLTQQMERLAEQIQNRFKDRLSKDERHFLDAEFPILVEYLEDLLQDDSPDAKTMVREYHEHLRGLIPELMELKEEFPEGYELEKRILTNDFESERLGEQIQAAPAGKKRQAMVNELKEMLDEVFDLKQKQRKLEAEQIARELEEIQGLIDQRQASRKTIVDRRLQDLTGQGDLYEW